jgi:predicted dehydrogenase
MSEQHTPNRRAFLNTAAAGAAVVGLGLTANAHAAGTDTIKVGIVGCGGRGSGAGENVLSSAPGVEIVALGDYFEAKAKALAGKLNKFAQNDAKAKELGNKANVSPDHCFGGLDAFEKVINAPGVNYVILATSPGFRPQHLQAAGNRARWPG